MSIRTDDEDDGGGMRRREGLTGIVGDVDHGDAFAGRGVPTRWWTRGKSAVGRKEAGMKKTKREDGKRGPRNEKERAAAG